MRDWVDGVDVQPGQLVLLENCRVNKGEKKNDEALARKMAALCDIFVHDAFGTAHRAEASTYGIAQFAKVVLLPQGDFAAFLRATPEERRVLLERLFDVSRFTGVEAWLTDRRRLTAATAAEARATLSADLLRVDDVLARVPAEVIDGLPTWAEATDTGRLAEVAAEASTRVGAHALAALTAAATAEPP